MHRLPRLCCLLVCSAPLAAQAHDLAFWRTKLDPAAAQPAADELPGLLRELDAMLAAVDPVQRDEVAFTLLGRWLYRDRCVPEPERRWLLRQWQARLRQGIEGPSGDGVVARSFAALALSLLVALDNEAPFLAVDEFAALLSAATAYLRDERDVRGFTPQQGWLHSVAHTADLLKFLLRSRHLTRAQQGDVLAALADKLAAVDVALTHGEDERLARAVQALLLREDLDRPAALAWLRTLRQAPTAEPSVATLARAHNQRALWAQLHLLLAADTRDVPSLVVARRLVQEVLSGEPARVPAEPAVAAGDDVASIDAIVRSLYAAISGPAGQARDWNRVRSLFHRHHRMVPLVRGRTGMQAVALSIEDYVQRSGPLLERDGFFEQEIARQVVQFGDLAHVWSTYEGRRRLDDAVPFLRGINSIQLVFEQGRWWVLQIAWQQEADAGPIPAGFLPPK
jgi:hypothetical protein